MGRRYNIIMIYNVDCTKILFCKRVKDPYKGKYNFPGGKVEIGENDFQAAYRELYEETGIRRSGYEIEKASYGIIGKESKVNPKYNRRYLQWMIKAYHILDGNASNICCSYLSFRSLFLNNSPIIVFFCAFVSFYCTTKTKFRLWR